MTKKDPKRGFEEHPLGTRARIDTYIETIKKLERQLAAQCALTTVGLLAIDPGDIWPKPCREDKTALYFIQRETGEYWNGRTWCSTIDDGIPVFAATFDFNEGVKLLQKRFHRGFPAKDVNNNPVWLLPPTLIPVSSIVDNNE